MTTALPRLLTPHGRTLGSLDAEAILTPLLDHGSLLLRGFSPTGEDIKSLGRRVIPRPRHTPAHRVNHPLHRSIQSVTPGMQAMGLHAEYSHLPDGVDVMAFWAEVPAGVTTLCDGAVLWRALREDTREWFEAHPLTFTAWHEPQAWIPACGTDDVAQVQRETAHIAGYAVKAGPLGGLLTQYTRMAALDVPGVTGKCLAANLFPQAYAALWVTDDSGAALPQPVLDNVWSTAERVQVTLQWEPGDVLWVHNRRVLHGRGQQGANRRAWALLGNL